MPHPLGDSGPVGSLGLKNPMSMSLSCEDCYSIHSNGAEEKRNVHHEVPCTATIFNTGKSLELHLMRPPRKIYARLPKHSPFIGTFHHAPSAGNKSRSVFFDSLLVSEEDHERQKRIKTNPFTGTFHYLPGKYSDLHGLQRFRKRKGFRASLDELDRLAKFGKSVSDNVRKAENTSLATTFMNSIFSASSVYVLNSLYPRKSKTASELVPDHLQVHPNQRYRYGGAVDMLRKCGSSLDDSSLTNVRGPSQYREILYSLNGFRLYFVQNNTMPAIPALSSYRSIEDGRITFGVYPGRGRGHIVETAPPKHTHHDEPSMVRHGSLLHISVGGELAHSFGDEDVVSEEKVARGKHPMRRSISWIPLTLQAELKTESFMTCQQEGMGSSSALIVQDTRVSDNYEIVSEVLGEGSYAKVQGAFDKRSMDFVAIKAIKRRYLFTEEEKNSVRQEIENMFRCSHHRNVIRLFETYEDDDHVYLVMERASYGNLEQILQLRRKLTELEAMWIIKQLLDAVEYLHQNGVLHCDIKPHNVLFCEVEGGSIGGQKKMWNYMSPLGMGLKLCDFGLSRKVPDVRYYKFTKDINKVPFSRVCGTGGYIAPEIIQKQSYGKAADLWSVGILCYRILCGAMPFIPPHRCVDHPVAFQGRVWEAVSNEAKDFIKGLLVVDQNRRSTAKQALDHRWLQTVPEWAPEMFSNTSARR